MIEPTRRSLITGLVSLIAAPAIVRVSSLMPVKQMVRRKYELESEEIVWTACGGDLNPIRFIRLFSNEGPVADFDLGIPVNAGDTVAIDFPATLHLT